MISFLLAPVRDQRRDPFERALAWRADSIWTRAGQASLIGLLSWLATDDHLVLIWLTLALALSAIDGWVSRWALMRPQAKASRAAACATHLLASTAFCAVIVPLLRTATQSHLAGAALVLCGVSLNNAMMARGSRLTIATVAGPSAVLLIVSPLITRLFGHPMTGGDVALSAAASACFAIFILRLAVTSNAEAQGLQRALEALRLQTDAAQAAERAAEDSQRRWRMIFDQAPVAQGVLNASRLHAFLTSRAKPGQSLGDALLANITEPVQILNHVEVLGTNDVVSALRGERPEDARFGRSYLEGLARALPGLGPDGVLPPFLAELVRANGDVAEVEVHIRFAEADGSPWSLCVVTYIDVTAARRAAREQAAALKAAEVANRAKSDFLAVISHELRTPLNGVLGMAQAMAGDRLSRAQRERLAVIGQSGAGLLAIVDDLLDLSRIEAGQLELADAEFDLAGLVEAVRATHAGDAEAKALGFAVWIAPPAAGRCRGDAARVRQVLDALVGNALKFTHDGEVSLNVAPGPRGLRCEVRDTGIGIAPDRIATLFEPFAQADSSLTRRYGGAGLGLALCRQLCRAMGGEISVQSRLGEGSRFTVDLPLTPQAARPLAAVVRTAAGGLAGPGIRVLAAEDNPVNQRVLSALLAQIGVTPTLVDNGLEAVRAWETGDWDLILMDVQMPVMDGQTAAREIRAREARLGRAPIPIIAVTANAMRHQIEGYRAAGITGVVAKPIDVQQLFAAMVAAVAQEEPAGASPPYASEARSSASLRASSARR